MRRSLSALFAGKSDENQECPHGDDPTSCLRCSTQDMSDVFEVMPMLPRDIEAVVRNLPQLVVDALKRMTADTILAGGFIRSVVGREPIEDIDIFLSEGADWSYVRDYGFGRSGWTETENSYTLHNVHECKAPIQAIKRWKFKQPAELLASFDMTVAMAAIWHDGKEWRGICHPQFYSDLASRKLCYRRADMEGDFGVGEITRVLKYVSKGYSMDAPDLARCFARCIVNLKSVQADETDLRQEMENSFRELELRGSSTWSDLNKPLARPKKKEYYSGS